MRASTGLVCCLIFFAMDGIMAEQSVAHAVGAGASERSCQATSAWGKIAKAGREMLDKTAEHLSTLDVANHPVVKSTVDRLDEMMLLQIDGINSRDPTQDKHLFESFDPQLWSIRADPPMVGRPCRIAYFLSYTASWVFLGVFAGFMQEFGMVLSDLNSPGSAWTMLFGYLALVTSGVYAFITSICGTDPGHTSTPCLYRSRMAFNYVWVGLLLCIMGNITAWVPQPRDQKLEAYMIEKQERTDRARWMQDTKSSPAARENQRLTLLRAQNMKEFARETRDAKDANLGSVVLKPIKPAPLSAHAMLGAPSALLRIGVVWIFVSVILVILACQGYGAKALNEGLVK